MVTAPASIARYLAAVGEATQVLPRTPNRGPPYWNSRVLRRRVLGDEDACGQASGADEGANHKTKEKKGRNHEPTESLQKNANPTTLHRVSACRDRSGLNKPRTGSNRDTSDVRWNYR